MTDSIQFGDTQIQYRLKTSASRKTLAISVAGQDVEVAAPRGLSTQQLQFYVRDKAGWILSKLDENQQIPPVYPRQMQSGETVQYLGRQYSLKVVRNAETRNVKLWRGELILCLQPGDEIKQTGEKMIKQWYQHHLRKKLSPLICGYANRLGLSEPAYEVRELGKRWGSCGKNGRLYFHWQLARLPMSKIEFVCAHEIVHLHEPNHSARFRKLLAQLVPQHEALSHMIAI